MKNHKKKIFSVVLLALLITIFTANSCFAYSQTYTTSDYQYAYYNDHYPETYPTISYGSTGYYVEMLQGMLNAIGYNVSIDGVFGSQTLSAVLSVQGYSGTIQNFNDYFTFTAISADGIVGLYTWGKIYCIFRHTCP